MKRVLLLALALVLVIILAGAGRYIYWVKNWENSADPFDEVGIDLHQMMPGFVQEWGCAQLFAEFGDKTLPPHGCRGKGGWPS